MKRSIITALLLMPAAAPRAQEFSTATMRAITPGAAYALAAAQSEALARQAEGLKQLEAAERGLAAAFRPVFEATASHSKQQNAAAATRGYVSGRYALFSGMRDYLAARAAASAKGAAALDLERARQQLYLDAARACLDLYAAQDEVGIRRAQMDVTARRIAELEARAAIGRSRAGEVLAARTQLAQDSASYLDAAGAERLAQQALKFLTGLAEDLAPRPVYPAREAALEEYLRLALLRPDLAAARKSAEAYDYLAELQDRALWPTVGLAADYYLVRSPRPRPENRWNASATASVPLYTGGAAGAARDAAGSARRSAGLALREAERRALAEVRAAYDERKYAVLREASLRDALALARDNARSQQEDYKLGLVNNLEVLNAQNAVMQTRLALSQAGVASAWALMKLEHAAGLEAKQ